MNSIAGRDLAVSAGAVSSNPGAASSRVLHVELTSQQRRLRHLRSIAARNIVNKNGSPLLDTYFTLHLCQEDRISRDFYKSEVIRDSLNPTWRSLDFAMLPDLLDTSVSCFVVRIWGGREEQYQLLIEWKVNLDGLRYTGQQTLCEAHGLFSFPQESSDRKKNSLLQVDQSSVRNSYSVFSLLRLHTAQRAIKQTQVTVQKIGKEIEEKLRTTASCTEKKKERECMQLRIGILRCELERQRKALARELDMMQKERAQLRKSLTELQKECTAKRELFLKSNAQLTFRCRQLISELSYIYPIDVNNQNDYVICGVKLPNSEDFQAKDDGSVAVALGYTAHLVLMISNFLQIPLRYPVIHKGSRSSIKDTITDKLTEKEREFPLYPRGERFQFEYGVYLLNKNIAQVRISTCPSVQIKMTYRLIIQCLRYQHGLSTPDLRQTLPNLKNFLEHGLLVRCDRHHVSMSIPVPLKSHLSVSTASEVGFPTLSSSPERDIQKWASSDADKQKCQTPPPSCNTAMTEPDPMTTPEVPSVPSTEIASIEEGKTVDTHGDGETVTLPSDSVPQHSGAMNGSVVPSEGIGLGVAGAAELCCSVEQAEEIMGTEATGLGLGLGFGLGLGGGARLDDFPCIPVEHAVAVECDEQVLGEFDAAGIEEVSRRIYALENMSSFRRPRKNSEK
uniref:UV radiation resistance-associated gene protein-like n=1 Tax=Sinocyclocheilus rhinocerous TaxID=307959 RepID=A0A673JSW5_9TELE